MTANPFAKSVNPTPLLQELGDPASVRRAITVALQLIVIQHKERKQS